MSILVEIAGQPAIEFPDGTDPKVIDAVVKRDFIRKNKQPVTQPEEQSGFSEFVTGAKRGLATLAGGIGQRLGAFSQQDVDSALKAMSEERKGEGFAGSAGEFVGSVAPTFLIPGGGVRTLVGKIASSTLQGGAIGAMQPTKTGESVTKNIGMGMATGGGTTALLAGASKAVPAVGRLAKETLGTSTGAGGGAVSEAIKGGEAFKKALRGEISGEDVVDTARSALQKIKDKRAADYQVKLSNISNKQIDMTPIDQHLNKLFKDYNIKKITNPVTGTVDIDLSRVAMGKKGVGDIQDVIEVFSDWGSKADDKTALGLDTLKRQLNDFYSESSQARQFVASLNKKIDETIRKNVPEYADMTKGYAEATKIIKDIESGLMMRKSGMTGRVVADQTLRRLMSSMRENFELRKDLVEVLGKEGGADIAGEIAGYSMNQALPRGLVGKLGAGAGSYAAFFNPQLLPVLAASSPRVVGEFLLLFGKAQRELAKGASQAGKIMPKNIISKTASVQATKPENRGE